jgi:transcriptional regulator with XRE-family HTH domain
LSPARLQKLLDGAGLSQRGAAKALGINERTMRKYVAGESTVPPAIEYALRWVIQRDCTLCNGTGRFWEGVDGKGMPCDHVRRVK